VPDISLLNIVYAIGLGVAFGLTAMLFSKSVHFFTAAFKKTIAYAPLRPFIGGIIIAAAVYAIGTTKYIGLGIPVIVDAFSANLNWYDFLLKLLFTTFTLGAGFKGGEVTPLFFIGAALGNVLAFFVPMPVALLAGMGFVAVFSGATNTPLACIVMGMELFGIESTPYIAIACITAYFFSGHTGIYTSQIHNGPKHLLHKNLRRHSV
jgi:H+/Cl- antiporter ClcA